MNKIIEIKFGSWLYGTNTPESDLDFKGIYLPTAREIILGSYKETISTSRKKQECERNTKDDVDREFFSLDRYLALLTEGQTVALDILFAPEFNAVITGIPHPICSQIYDNKDKLLTRNVNAFYGYAKQQAARYGIKGSRMDALKRVVAMLEPLPLYDKLNLHTDKIDALVKECQELISLEKTALVEILQIPNGDKATLMPHLHVNGRKCPFNATVKVALGMYSKILAEYGGRAQKAHLSGGKDWKALSHAVRVNSEAMELLIKGYITFPRPDRELLVKIKTEQMPYEEVAEIIEEGLVKLTEAHETSQLREAPDQEWVDNFIYDIYSSIVRESK